MDCGISMVTVAAISRIDKCAVFFSNAILFQNFIFVLLLHRTPLRSPSAEWNRHFFSVTRLFASLSLG
jgi:hypothetical protein